MQQVLGGAISSKLLPNADGISRIDLMNILYADDEAGGPDCAGTVSMRSLYKQTIAA
jgi:hypothetical protein